jgi:gamma-glutamyltranspeptidase / glutathione hydrolase
MRISNIVSCIFFLSLSTSSYAMYSQPVAAKQGMVVSEQQIASQVGADILHAGGNAVDAAVAVGYALAVVNPCCGNIGGGGFMVIHLADGTNTVLNFREKAPHNASKNMFLDASGLPKPGASTRGYLAVAVPGTVLGLDSALTKYGTMTRKQVMAPAIRLAQQGYSVTPFDTKWFNVYAPIFRDQKNVAKIFLKNGQPYEAGELLIQHDLANTLKLISENGPDIFYKGSIAQQIVNSSQANGGMMTMQDFATYNVEELRPLVCDYHGYTIVSVPPPSSGGVTLCEILTILQNFPLAYLGFQSAQSMRDIVEAMRYGFNDRNSQLGDPDFIHNPIDKLLSQPYTTELMNKINETNFEGPNFEGPNNSMIDFHEQTDTTHYSIVDKKGNAVAVTYTLNSFFGAKVIADNTGFFLNDEMDDFAVKPGMANIFDLVQYDANAIAAGKRPLSSMTPTIVMKNNRVFLVLGSPGGPRIITSVLLTLLNVIDYGMNIKQAVDAPRFHYQGIPDFIAVEPFALSFITSLQLNYWGYHITPQERWGAVEAILIDPMDGTFYGANDDRRPDGAAIGF